ncbi:MAG: amidohydrolase family protein [Candidatus Heimdallarchaeota archaeon]
MKIKVVDFHVHALSSEADWHPWVVSYGFDMNPTLQTMLIEVTTPTGLWTYLSEQGIDLAVILAEDSPVTTTAKRGTEINEFIAKICSQNPDKMIPFCSVNPKTVARPAKELQRLVEDLGFKGLKLYPPYQLYYPNDQEIYPLYAKAEELGIPVMVHTGSSVFRGARLKYGDPLYLDDVAVDFPDLKLLQVHSGRGFWYDQAFFLAKLHKNVYLEIAGLPPQNLLKYFPKLEKLADKFIFGSDWPGVPSIKKNIKIIRELPLSSETKRKILGQNALRILKSVL